MKQATDVQAGTCPVGALRTVVATVLLMGMLATVHGQGLLNGDFEVPNIADGAAGSVPSPWSGSGRVVDPDVNGNVAGSFAGRNPQAASGDQYMELGPPLTTALTQTFTVSGPGEFSVVWSDNSLTNYLPDTAPYIVSLFQGGQQLAYVFLDAYHPGHWEQRALPVTIFAGTYTLNFYESREPRGQAPTFIDNVRLVAVPEPPVRMLLSLGLGAVLVLRTRPSDPTATSKSTTR